MFWFATLNGARANTNEHDCVVDTRLKIPGESIGTVVSTHEIIRAASAFGKQVDAEATLGGRSVALRFADDARGC